MRGHLEHLFADCDSREMHRRTGRHRLPAGEAALPVRNDRGVARNDGDIIGTYGELFGTDLRQGRANALPHRHGACVNRDAPGPPDADDSGFEWSTSGALYAAAQADAEVTALLARAALALGKTGIIDRLGRHLDAAWKITAVVGHRRPGACLQRRDVGHLLRGHNIAPPYLDAIELEFARDGIEQPFHRECGFGITRATHRHGGDLVGFDDPDPQVIGRHDVRPRHPG